MIYLRCSAYQSMKSYIWLQTSDGTVQEVEQAVALLCPYIYHGKCLGVGSSKNNPISLSSRVKPTSLSLIFDYCRFHRVPGRSNKVRYVFQCFLLSLCMFFPCFFKVLWSTQYILFFSLVRGVTWLIASGCNLFNRFCTVRAKLNL